MHCHPVGAAYAGHYRHSTQPAIGHILAPASLDPCVPRIRPGFLGSRAVAAAGSNALLVLIFGVATAAVALLAYVGMARLTERRRPTELAGRGAASSIGRGLLVGLLLFAAVIMAIAISGGYHVLGFGSTAAAVTMVGVNAAAAVTEELAFRGVLFRVVEQRAGSWIALAGTGVLFGGMHLLNPDATVWGAVAIAVEAGGMLGAAFLATRKLWLPIGLHFGWNLAESGIFGTEMSGSGAPDGLLHSVSSGPMLLTGGEFGPEASVFSVIAGLLMTMVFLWLARRRGNLVAFLPLRRHTVGAAEPGSAVSLAK